MIKGTTKGVVVEWDFHNVAYVGGCILNSDSIKGMAGNLNVGKTIFDDNHGSLTWDAKELGLLYASNVMKSTYSNWNLPYAIVDFLIQIFS